MSDIEVMTLEEADAAFGVRSVFDLRHAEDSGEVVVFRGSATVENVPLDYWHLDTWTGHAASDHRFWGMIVDGDLEVRDFVTNWDMDYGPFLWVRGDLRAKNLATAGSEVVIAGDLTVAQTIAGYYNHGSLVVHGDTRAEVILPYEHLLEFRGAVEARLVHARNFVHLADPATARVEHWVGVPCGLDGHLLDSIGTMSRKGLRLLDPEFLDWSKGSLWKAVEAGRSLLRAEPLIDPPLSDVESVRAVQVVLRAAGCVEQGFSDGFCVDDEDDGVYVYFEEGDHAPGDLDPADERRRYEEALTAAGHVVSLHPDVADVLVVRPGVPE